MSLEPSLSAALAHAEKLDGWNFFEHAAEPKTGASLASVSKQRADDAACALARFAASADGELALEMLLDVTLRRPSFVALLGLPMEQAYGYGAFREGQNSLMVMILKMIAAGRKEQTPQERGP